MVKKLSLPKHLNNSMRLFHLAFFAACLLVIKPYCTSAQYCNSFNLPLKGNPIDSSRRVFKIPVQFAQLHHYQNKITFANSDFRNVETDFTYVWFYDNADFSFARLNPVSFYGAVFNKSVKFSGADFSTLGFDLAVFYGNADFSRLKNQMCGLSFNHAYLKDTIDLSYNPVLKNEVDLSHLSFPCDSFSVLAAGDGVFGFLNHYFRPYVADTLGRHFNHINLYNTDVSKVVIDYSRFRLYFKDINAVTDATIKERTLAVRQEPDELDRDKKASVYEGLLKNFKERGQLESCRKLDIEYRYFRANGGFWAAQLPDWWNRFGYEKERVFVHAAVFLLFFTLCTFFLLPFLQRRVYPLRFISERSQSLNEAAYYNKINKVRFLNYDLKHLWYAFVYTCILFFKFSLKVEDMKYDAKLSTIMGTLYVLVVYITGIVCLAYMAGFVLQK